MEYENLIEYENLRSIQNEDYEKLYESIHFNDSFDASVMENDTTNRNDVKRREDQSSLNPKLSCLRNILFAVCVLPLTAGDPLKPQITRVRDGKVSSLVSLTFCVALFMTIIFVSLGFTPMQLVNGGIIFMGLITFIMLLTVIIYLMFICQRNRISRFLPGSDHDQILSVKIAFTGIFSIASILSFCIKMSLHIVCPGDRRIYNNLRISIDNLNIIFYILQFFFIVIFARKKIVKSCLTYFGATAVVATNAAAFFFHSAKVYFEETGHNETLNACWNMSVTFKIYQKSKPYLNPAMLENALLSILIIGEIFSREMRSKNDVDNETTKFEMDESHVSIQNNCAKSRPVIITLFALFISAPYILIKEIVLQGQSEPSSELYIIQPIYQFIFCLFNYLLIIRCFYFLHVNGRDLLKFRKMPLKLKHYLILLSSFGTMVYFSLHLIASIIIPDRKLYILGNIANIFASYIQTILILQLKGFENAKHQNNILSMRNIFLFLSFSNFGLWCYYTFFEAAFVYKRSYTIDVYGFQTILTARNVLLPMLIFYRFKCFLSFLEITHCSFKCCKRTHFTRKSTIYESI